MLCLIAWVGWRELKVNCFISVTAPSASLLVSRLERNRYERRYIRCISRSGIGERRIFATTHLRLCAGLLRQYCRSRKVRSISRPFGNRL